MAQTRVLQRRIRSVKNAKQITKALEVVAASRMRKVVGLVEGARSYGELAATIMQRISDNPEAKSHPFFIDNRDKPTLYVVFNSDRGQAGAFNSNIFNLAVQSFKTDKARPQIVSVGRKGSHFFAHLQAIELKGAYENIADVPDPNVFAPVIELIEDEMAAGRVGQLVIIYTQFVSSLVHKATYLPLLPLAQNTEDNSGGPQKVYEFEPEITNVLDEAIRLYIQARLMQSRIESAASEHAMRMIAMGNANRNASDLIDNLTLELNATRQAAITQEIAEITGGAAAIAA